MRTYLMTGASLALWAACPAPDAMAEETTRLENGQNRAIVRQSGDGSGVRRSIEVRPGHTRIEQRSRNNSAIIVQDSGSPGPEDE